MEEIKRKICNICKQKKSLSKFHKNCNSKDGRAHYCKQCYSEYYRKYSQRPEVKKKKKEYTKEYHARPETKELMRQYRIKTKDKIKERQRKFWKKHYAKHGKERCEAAKAQRKDPILGPQLREKRRVWERAYRKKKYHLDSNFRLKQIIGSGIQRSLKNGKNGNHWETLVGYTITDLRRHLEKQFEPGMTWKNHGRGKGTWQIHHKIPLAVHNFNRPEDIDFIRCWSLKNLKPMWTQENMEKNDKLDKPFQPSLAISPLMPK